MNTNHSGREGHLRQNFPRQVYIIFWCVVIFLREFCPKNENFIVIFWWAIAIWDEPAMILMTYASEGRSDCASENRPDGGKIFWEYQLEQCDNISVSNKWQIIISLWRPIYLHVHSTYVYNTIMRFIPKPLSEYSHSTTINLPVWPEFYIKTWFFLDPG